jgi:hypothetical protein
MGDRLTIQLKVNCNARVKSRSEVSTDASMTKDPIRALIA